MKKSVPGAEELAAGASLSALHEDQKSNLGDVGETSRHNGGPTSMAAPSVGVSASEAGLDQGFPLSHDPRLAGHPFQQPQVPSYRSGEHPTALQQQIGSTGANTGYPSSTTAAVGNFPNIMALQQLYGVGSMGTNSITPAAAPAAGSSGAADSVQHQEWQAQQEQEARLYIARMAQLMGQQPQMMNTIPQGMQQQQQLPTMGAASFGSSSIVSGAGQQQPQQQQPSAAGAAPADSLFMRLQAQMQAQQQPTNAASTSAFMQYGGQQPTVTNTGMPDPLAMASAIRAQQQAMMLQQAPLGMTGNRPYRKAATFPMKLMQILRNNPNPEAVAWLPDGKSFVVIDEEKLCNEVLDNTFKSTKYTSFVRKLNRWGFVRMASGTGTDCFHHPLFLRDFPDLCVNMVSVQQGGEQADQPNDDPSLQRKRKKKRRKVDIQYQQASAAFGGTYPIHPPSLQGMDQFFLANSSKKSRSDTVEARKEAEESKDGQDGKPPSKETSKDKDAEKKS